VVENRDALEAARQKRRDLYEAMVEVEAAAQAPVGTGIWRSVMLGELDDLSHAFEAHVIATEADDGIIESVVEDEPRMAPTGEYLKREHLALRTQLASVTDEVRATASPTSPEEAATVRELILDLFIALSRHRQRGSDFVWEAYDVDIGGGS
jgi:hypothetical protein